MPVAFISLPAASSCHMNFWLLGFTQGCAQSLRTLSSFPVLFCAQVISADGNLYHEEEEGKGQPVHVGNLAAVIRFSQFTFDLFPVGAVEIVFRFKGLEGERVRGH